MGRPRLRSRRRWRALSLLNSWWIFFLFFVNGVDSKMGDLVVGMPGLAYQTTI